MDKTNVYSKWRANIKIINLNKIRDVLNKERNMTEKITILCEDAYFFVGVCEFECGVCVRLNLNNSVLL